MFIQLYVMLFISFMKLSLAVPSEIMIDTDDSADNPREVYIYIAFLLFLYLYFDKKLVQ